MNSSDRLAYVISEAMLDAFEADPARGLAIARKNIAVINRASPNSRSYMDTWEALLSGPFDVLRARVLALTDEGQVLRSTTPLAGLVDEETRQALLRSLRT